jgi:hypothetical protein
MARKPFGRGCFRLYLFMALASALTGLWFFGAKLVEQRGAAMWFALVNLLFCIGLFTGAIAALRGLRWGVYLLFAAAFVYLASALTESSLFGTATTEVSSAIFLLVILLVLGIPELIPPKAQS